MRPTRPTSSAIRAGYRSGLEVEVAKQIEQHTGEPALYETSVIEYVKPARVHKYKPDFVLPNGIIVETKGIFDAADREKHLLVKEQHEELDIRFVFSRSAAPIYPRSKTTLAEWCVKFGFMFSDKLIPLAWFRERKV